MLAIIQPKLNPSRVMRVLEGVVDQDPQKLFDRVGIALDRHRHTVQELDAP